MRATGYLRWASSHSTRTSATAEGDLARLPDSALSPSPHRYSDRLTFVISQSPTSGTRPWNIHGGYTVSSTPTPSNQQRLMNGVPYDTSKQGFQVCIYGSERLEVILSLLIPKFASFIRTPRRLFTAVVLWNALQLQHGIRLKGRAMRRTQTNPRPHFVSSQCECSRHLTLRHTAVALAKVPLRILRTWWSSSMARLTNQVKR